VKERPILFSGPMVRALVEGRKTQTRRAMKPQPVHGAEYAAKGFEPPCALHLDFYGNPIGTHTCPYGAPGDRLWVRETWALVRGGAYQRSSGDYDDPSFFEGKVPDARPAGWGVTFQNEWPDLDGTGPWRPSIHMPRWASRLTLEVTEVRVQRLHDISSADACAEGCVEVGHGARANFQALWKTINGPDSWDANPWCWCISFKRVER